MNTLELLTTWGGWAGLALVLAAHVRLRRSSAARNLRHLQQAMGESSRSVAENQRRVDEMGRHILAVRRSVEAEQKERERTMERNLQLEQDKRTLMNALDKCRIVNSRLQEDLAAHVRSLRKAEEDARQLELKLVQLKAAHGLE